MSDRECWIRAAKRLSFRRNVAFWADGFLPIGLAVTVAAAAALLVLRLLGLDPRMAWICWGGALLIATVAQAAMVARRPFTMVESLARLDEIERLHNRLVSAFEGIGEWPRPRAGIRDAVRWDWARIGVPLLIGGLLLGAVSVVELPRTVLRSRPSEEPIAWTKMDSWIKTLQKAQLLEKPALDKLQEQLDDLRHQPDQDWYSQSSLEAGDALRQQTEQSLRQLQENLQKSADLMSQAQQANQMSGSQLQSLSASMKDMAQGMISGNLPLNKELAGKMQSFDPSTLRAMSQQELRQLQQRLDDDAKVCAQCVGPRPGRFGTTAKLSPDSGGRGGGGPAPLGLDQAEENLHTKRLEGSSNQDPTRTMPGEVIAIAKGKHAVDKNTPAGPVAGGAIASEGEGGDAVWRDSLTPDDRQVLQKYFK